MVLWPQSLDLHEFKTKQERRQREKKEAEERRETNGQKESKSSTSTTMNEQMDALSPLVIPDIEAPANKRHRS